MKNPNFRKYLSFFFFLIACGILVHFADISLNYSELSSQDKTRATQISIGSFHSCALLSDKTVRCWGGNGMGSLGDGTTKNSNIPVQVVGLQNVKSVLAGYQFSCALLEDATIKCWGAGNEGWGKFYPTKRGDWALPDKCHQGGPCAKKPFPVSHVKDVEQLTGTHWRMCVLKKDKTVYCWGDHMTMEYEQPGQREDIAILKNFKTIHAGQAYGCGLEPTGLVRCWGHPDSTGLPEKDCSNVKNPSAIEITFNGEKKIIEGEMGKEFVDEKLIEQGRCSIRNIGGENNFCCKKNPYRDEQGHEVTPVKCTYFLQSAEETQCKIVAQTRYPAGYWPVTNLKDVARIFGGESSTFAILKDGSLMFWGSEHYVFPGTCIGPECNVIRMIKAAEKVPYLKNVKDIGIGTYSACAIGDTGNLQCWGTAYGVGLLGNGEELFVSSRPVAVKDLKDVVSVGVGHHHACALTNQGKVKCWGGNYDGKNFMGLIGADKKTKFSAIPVQVEGL